MLFFHAELQFNIKRHHSETLSNIARQKRNLANFYNFNHYTVERHKIARKGFLTVAGNVQRGEENIKSCKYWHVAKSKKWHENNMTAKGVKP